VGHTCSGKKHHDVKRNEKTKMKTWSRKGEGEEDMNHGKLACDVHGCASGNDYEKGK